MKQYNPRFIASEDKSVKVYNNVPLKSVQEINSACTEIIAEISPTGVIKIIDNEMPHDVKGQICNHVAELVPKCTGHVTYKGHIYPTRNIIFNHNEYVIATNDLAIELGVIDGELACDKLGQSIDDDIVLYCSWMDFNLDDEQYLELYGVQFKIAEDMYGDGEDYDEGDEEWQ